MYYLGIDCGATSSKWSAFDENGELVFSFVENAITGTSMYSKEGLERLSLALQNGMTKVNGKIAGAVLGVTGVEDYESRVKFRELVNSVFKIGNENIKILHDLTLLYLCKCRAQDKLLYAGTGSVGYYIKENGEVSRTGGWGFVLGDEGAGFLDRNSGDEVCYAAV